MELENYIDHGDEGEIWFGKAVERRVIDWIKTEIVKSTSNPCILDLGCGNGHFTKKLIEAGLTKVYALDYSEKAVELSRKLVFPDNKADECINNRIFQADILNISSISRDHVELFDLIVDKGTFDAISLNPDFSGHEKVSKTEMIADCFKKTLKSLLNPSALSKFIITSCNWTSSELEQIFEPEFKVVGEIQHTKFVFGGKSGQDVSTLVFEINQK